MTKDQILTLTILHNNTIEARRTIRAFDDDGSLIGERHQRVVYEVGTPFADLPAGKIRQIAQLLWA